MSELNRQIEFNSLNDNLKKYFIHLKIDIYLINDVMLSLNEKGDFEFSFLVRNSYDATDIHRISLEQMCSILKTN